MLRNVSKALRDLGLASDDFDLLLLVPVAAVAWADGEAAEGAAAMTAAIRTETEQSGKKSQTHELSTAARELAKERLISKAPSAKRLNQWLDLLAEYLESIPYRQAQNCRDSITRMCVTAAGQSGVGLLGMFERTSRAEKQVMRDLAERLDLEKGHEACQLLHDMGLCDGSEAAGGAAYR